MDPRAFYRLATHDWLDNPDQRITQDVDKFSYTLRVLVQKLCVTPVLIVYYTYKCWQISGYMGPLVTFVFFIVSVVASRLAMPPVIKAIYLREREEGNFRHVVVWMIKGW
jgi:ATP-binding cassette subfamily D (ALD) protein 4